jgi:HNH endonuclease
MAGPRPTPLWQKVVDKICFGGSLSGCWLWRGFVRPAGYGQVGYNDGRTRLAHRAVYEHLTGEVLPPGVGLDHLCREPLCVNPLHLEQVPQAENHARGLAKHNLAAAYAAKRARTHCNKGHEFTEQNTYVWDNRRHCRVCRDLCRRQSRAR